MKASSVAALLALAVSQSFALEIFDENDFDDVVEGLGKERTLLWNADGDKLGDKLITYKEGTIEEDHEEKLDDSLMEKMQAQLGAVPNVPFCNADGGSCGDGMACELKVVNVVIDETAAPVRFGQCVAAPQQ